METIFVIFGLTIVNACATTPIRLEKGGQGHCTLEDVLA